MQFSGTYLFFADRMRIWRALNDTKVLKLAIPRCETIEWSSDNTLDLAIKVNLGVVKPRFSGELALSEVKEAHSYVLSGRGHGGILGLARGSAEIFLRDYQLSDSDFDGLSDEASDLDIEAGNFATLLSFTARGGASKHIMSLGKSIVGKSAQGIIDRFMGRFSAAMQVPVKPLNSNAVPPD